MANEQIVSNFFFKNILILMVKNYFFFKRLVDFFDIVQLGNFSALFTKDPRVYRQYGYDYKFVLDIEKPYFDKRFRDLRSDWMYKNWHYSIYFSLVYIVLIFLGQAFMKNRERFTLQKPLIIWNLFLAIFSFVGAVRFADHMIYIWSKYGLEHSYCKNDFVIGVTACWGWLFALSKVAELIDTVFIVLRKQKLIFLHW
jgi:hypothetical protein